MLYQSSKKSFQAVLFLPQKWWYQTKGGFWLTVSYQTCSARLEVFERNSLPDCSALSRSARPRFQQSKNEPMFSTFLHFQNATEIRCRLTKKLVLSSFLEVLVARNVSAVLVLVGQVLRVAVELQFFISEHNPLKVRDGHHPTNVFSGCTLKGLLPHRDTSGKKN